MFAFHNKPRTIISCLQIINSNLGFLVHVSRNIANASSSSSRENNKICSKNHSFPVSYLINNIGLSPQVAISKSHKLKFDSSHKPDTVVALFRDHGFDKTHVFKIISTCPELLMNKPHITLLPKLKFLSSIGMSSDILASNPYLLSHSLKNRIVPFYDFCKSMLLSDEQIVRILRGRFVLRNSQPGDCSTVKLLKEVGVGKRCIGQLIYRKPRFLNVDYDKVKTYVYELLELKFGPCTSAFVLALSVRIQMSNITWAHKMEVYKRWGWTEDEVLLAFKKHPSCMTLSEEKIMSVMDFLVNKMGFQSMVIAKLPVVLTYSLKLRMIPRCSVMKSLQMKGLINEDLSLLSLSFLISTEKIFVNRFIIKYQEQLPQLLTEYQRKLAF